MRGVFSALSFQLVQGIWNPAEQKYSWVVAAEFDTEKEAQAEFDGAILGVDPNQPGMSEILLAREARQTRVAYDGPPFAIVRVVSHILDRIGGEIEEEDAG